MSPEPKREDFPRAMALLRQIEAREQLAPEDVGWLMEKDYWIEALRMAWHRLEAEALTREWEQSGDAWAAVNASKHWRKAGCAEKALEVTEAALVNAGADKKLGSALRTTRGGAMRDTGRLDDAKMLGLEAHALTSADFRPCTLLGAVAMESGDFAAGHAWYRKAESLGAKPDAIDQELRTLLDRLAPGERERLRDALLRDGPERFAWAEGWRANRGMTRRSRRAWRAASDVGLRAQSGDRTASQAIDP